MSNDLTITCFDRNFTNLLSFQMCIRDQALSQMRYMSTTQAQILTFIYAFISLLGAFGNGLVIFVVARRSEMRTTRNVFIVNLALSNFLLALILVPFLWLPTFRIEFPYGSILCKVAQASPSLSIFCSALTVSVIAIDRYYVVVKARLGESRVKTIQAVSIAVAIWFISFALSILYFLHFHTKDYTLPRGLVPDNLLTETSYNEEILLFQRCELKPQNCNGQTMEECYKFYEAALGALNAIFIYFVPMPILIIFSCLLSRFLANNQRQHSLLRHRVCLPTATAAATGGVVTTTTTTATTTTENERNSLGAALLTAANSVIGRRSNNHNNNHRQNRMDSANSTSATCRRRSRTTSLLFAMAFSLAILWLPFIIVSMIIQLAPNQFTRAYQNELRHLDDAAKLISMLSICVNPFLYGYLNTNFNREFKIILSHCCPCLTTTLYSSNSSRTTSMMLSLRSNNNNNHHQARHGPVQMVKEAEMDSSACVFLEQNAKLQNCIATKL